MSYQRQTFDSILKKIEYCWQISGSPARFTEVMRRALPFPDRATRVEQHPLKWAALPGTCCQAVGGDPGLVDGFAAAWFLFYVAAHMMDNIEDQDIQENPQPELGPGAGINIASGLYFSASLLLESLHTQSSTSAFASEIIADFYKAFLRMCGGQQRDLDRPASSLTEYWENAADKSGVFFSMACRLGARFGTSKPGLLADYENFGLQVGLLIQVLDDLLDFRETGAGFRKISFPVLSRSLPVVYALDVLPEPEAVRLKDELKRAEDEGFARKAFLRIENCGASLYILSEIERLRDLARTSLEHAHPLPPADVGLYDVLGDLTYQF